jgi:hypothetical protein
VICLAQNILPVRHNPERPTFALRVIALAKMPHTLPPSSQRPIPGQNNWLINNIKINNLTNQMHREMSNSNPAKNGNFLSKTAIFTSKSPQRYTNFAAAI